MAAQTATKLKEGRTAVMNTVKNIHNNVLETADVLIDESVNSGVKYQKMAVKAIKKTEPLLDKQVEIVFDTLESVVDQFESSNKRFQKLLGITKTVKKLKSNFKKTVKSTSENIENATETIKKTAEKVEDNFEKISKRINEVSDNVEKRIRKAANNATDSVKKSSSVNKTVQKTVKRQKAAVKVTASKLPALTSIKGVGPKMEAKLNEVGINSIQDLANMTAKELSNLFNEAGSTFKNIDAAAWIKSAKSALK